MAADKRGKESIRGSSEGALWGAAVKEGSAYLVCQDV